MSSIFVSIFVNPVDNVDCLSSSLKYPKMRALISRIVATAKPVHVHRKSTRNVCSCFSTANQLRIVADILETDAEMVAAERLEMKGLRAQTHVRTALSEPSRAGASCW